MMVSAKFRIFLWLAALAMLLSLATIFIGQPVEHSISITKPLPVPSSAPGAGPAALNGASASSQRPKDSADHFEKAAVLDERLVTKKGTENRVTRLRLVKQADFKYPLIRVEDELRVEAGGEERLLRQTAYVADHVMVRVREGVTPEELEKALASLGAKVRDRKPLSGIWLVSFANPDLDTVGKALQAFAALPETARYAEPDYIVHASVLPNDTSFTELWGLHNTGQAGGTPDADIDAPEAWNLTTGSADVLVGVIDTGIDHTHPDLVANMWTNPNEIAGNGIDDDGNGYIDDTRGWDFANNDNNPMDDNNHGTHCAGTIGGAGNNASGVAGVNWQVSLVGLKFLTGSGSGVTSDAVEATAYATSIGVDLTSNSWGGGGFEQSLKDVIDAADAAGILFVAAAGNASSDTDSLANYPSGYTSPNIIAVASTTRTDGLSSFSNYGATTVDLGAPGSDIYSSIAGGSYSTFSGTSMATPHVAGACALLKAYRPTLTHSEIKGLIMQSADAIPALAGKCITGGRLNVYNAMLFSSDVTMSPGIGLMASGPMGGPLSPTTLSYTLTNRDTQPAVWTASSDQPWMTISSTGGTLAAGATATLTVTLTHAVNQLPGGTHQATLTVTNTTRGTSQTRTAVLDILPPVIVSETLDTDPGWPMTGQWAYGTPMGGGGLSHGYPDPTSGATGTKVLGVNLAGDYSLTPGGPWHVTAGPFDLSQHQATQLEYKRWLNIDGAFWVPATVQVSNDNLTWTTLWSSSGHADTAWTTQRHVLGSVADQHAQVWVRWTYQVNNVFDVWAFSGWNIDDIVIRGVPVKSLALSLPASLTEGAASATATLNVTPVPTSDQIVTLTSSDASQLTAPASITVPAGQGSVTFQISAVDDALADGTQTVSLTASSAGFQDRAVSLEVHDNETRVLTLSLPSTLVEGSGQITGQASLGLDVAADRDLRVVLSSSDPGELSVPASITIPAGQTSVALTLTVPEDALIDGTQNVTVTATVQNWTTASTSSAITDNEALTLTVTLPSGLLEGSSAPLASVALTGLTPVDVIVSLASSDTSEITVPATVTVPIGSSSVSFPVTIIDDGVADTPQSVTITASASGFSSGSAQTVVYDVQTPATPASPAPGSGASGISPETDLAWGIANGTGGTPTSFDVYFGTNATPGAAEFAGNATTAAWMLPRLTPGSTYYWQVISKIGSVTTPGPVWSFTVAPVGQPVRYAWDSIPSPQSADTLFTASVTAYDAYDNIATPFNGSAAVSTVRSSASILITEVEPNTPDAIEFVNVSSSAVDVSGWTVSIYDYDTWPLAKTFVFPTGSSCPASGVFRITENGTSPGVMPLFNFGSNINWTSDASVAVAVLLRKPDGSIVDFMCAAAATPSLITSPVSIPANEWSGAAIAAPTNSAFDYARQGTSDLNSASGWITATPGIGTVNPGLTVPFPGTGLDVPVLPENITFASGVWTGDLRVRGAAALTQLRAEDAQGRRGDSNAFTVTSQGLLGITVSASTYSESAGSQPAAITVTLPAAAATAVTVTVASSDPSEATAGTVSIPAGQLSGTVDLTLVDDAGLDGTQQATLEASAPGYTPKAASIQVTDSESTTLTLSAPVSFGENAGVQTAQGSVSIPEPALGDVLVALSSSDTSEITVPASVTIPAGQSTATFNLTVVQDNLLDGAQNVTLTASVTNWTSGTAVVTVTDDETASIAFEVDAATNEGVGTDPSIARVTLGGVAVEPVTITLNSSDPGELSLPATITIPAGQSTADISGTVTDDADLDGTQAVTLSAATFGNPPVTGTVDVRDNDAASFVFGSISSPQFEGQPFQLTITARDINGLTLPAVAGPVTQTAADGSGPLDYEYNAAAAFVNGVWQQNVRVLEPATGTRITVTGPQATAQSNAFDVGMGPRIAVNPASYTLDIPRQSSKTRSLTITNTGALPLTWNLAGPAWVTADPESGTVPFDGVLPASGTVPAGESATVPLIFSAASLPEGTTTGTLTMTSNDVMAGTLAIPVTLNVTPPVATFVWDTVPSPQRVNAPIPVTLTAKDASGNTVTGFEDVVNLHAYTGAVGPSTVQVVSFIGYADVAQEYVNTKLAISRYFTDYVETSFSGTTEANLAAALIGKHVLLIPEQENGSMSQLQSLGTAWAATLNSFVSQGGVVIVCSNHANEEQILVSSGLLTVTKSGAPQTASLEIANATFLNAGVTSPITSEWLSTYMTTTDGIVSIRQQSTNLPVVLHRQSGLGKVILIGTDYYTINTSMDRVVANAVAAGGPLVMPQQITPTQTAAFVNGVWTGNLTARTAFSNGWLRAAMGNTFGDSNVFDVTADGTLEVSLAASPVSESAGTLSGTVTVSPAPVADLTVTLSSSVSSAAVPASATVTVLAGSTSAAFTLNITDDAALDGPQTTQIGAVAAGYVAVSTPLVVADDEGAVLTINLAANSYSEAAGAVSGTITSDQPPTVPVTIQLASDDTSEATVPASITLAAGATSVPFTLTVVNDTLVDGDQNVILTASVAGWASGTKNLTITDNEARTLTLSGVPASISEGAATLSTASVALSGPSVAPVEVTLTSSDPSALPSLTVTIPAGASSAVFDLDPVDDALLDGTQSVTLTASAATFTDAMANVAVLDDDVAQFALSIVPAQQMEGVPFAFTATAKDINNVTITTAIAGPVNLMAAGDGGSLSVLPSGPLSFTAGVWTGNVRVMSPGTNVRLTVTSPTATNASNAFDVGMGPRLSVNPSSLAMNVAQKFSKTRTVTLSNTGASALNWSTSQVGTLNPPLEDVLAGINARHAEITALVPNRFNFTEGVTGTTIVSGGGAHMYHSGNVLGTSAATGTPIPYSNNTIVSATSFFGTGGRYFTIKQPGLFVLAADMSGINEFTITGGTGNHSGLVEGSVLTAMRSGRTYKAFVKRARGDVSWNAESVNHLVIIENDASAAQSFSSIVDNDDHHVTGLGTRTRLYYLLYSAVSGGNVNDAATQAIFEKFLDVIGVRGWISMAPASGTIPPGGSQDVAVTFSAGTVALGTYTDNAIITSNDATTSPLSIPSTMTVTPGVHHFDWDAIASPQTVNSPFAATIRAKDDTGATVTDFEGTVALTGGIGGSVAARTLLNSPASTNSSSGGYYTLGYSFTPSSNLTVSAVRSISGTKVSIWTDSGSLLTSVPVTATGGTWSETPLPSPLVLQAGTTYRVGFLTAGGVYHWSYSLPPTFTDGVILQSYEAYTDGFPVTVTSGNVRWWFVDLKYQVGTPAPVSPGTSGAFASGVWSGPVSVGSEGSAIVTATAADGSKGTSNSFTITSTGTLGLTIPASVTEGQGTLANAGAVTISAPLASPLSVSLDSLDTSEITLPASVIIPAGQTSANFDVTVVDDTLLDGMITARTQAYAIGYPTVEASSNVGDNDTTSVTVTLPATLAEGIGSTAQGTVQLGTAAASNLTLSLSSSLTSRVTVPASVTIPAGQSSATFTLAAVDNSIIDGSQTATITASLAGSPPGTSTIQITDNESTLLTLLTFYSSVSEGSAPITGAGYVYLSGSVTSPLTINLVSSDTSELTVPATLTIPAGSSSSSYFPLTPVNDTLKDGSQTVTLTASAVGFTYSARTVTVTDDDVASFTVSSVASPQIRNAPFNVTFTAKDINGVTISNYTGSPALTAASSGTALSVTPATVTGFSSGTKTQAVTLADYATAAVLTITDAAAAASGSSNAFAVGTGSLHHFSWASIPSPQPPLTPFTVGIQARDAYENLVTGFTGSTQLSAFANLSTSTSGTGTGTHFSPILGYAPQNRCQMIYLPAEVGASARTLRALAFDLSSIGRASFSNMTIRLKHTFSSSYSTTAWESSGWTVVYQGPVTLGAIGWKQINFTAPFEYNGTSNLMVDISSNLSSWSSDYTYIRNTPVGAQRTLSWDTSGQADPLSWTGSSPSGSIYTILPNLRLLSYDQTPITPTSTTSFVAGAWTGSVTLSTPGSVTLGATDPVTGSSGSSNAITVNSLGSLSLNLEATTVWETIGTVSATLTIPIPQATDTSITLSSSQTTTAAVPASVTILAGQTTVTFPVTVPQDTLLEGTQSAVLEAMMPGYTSGTANLTVFDDETTTVTVSLPVSLTEGSSTTGGQATVTLGSTVANEVTLSLASSLPSRLTVPATLTIPAGQSSASFILTAPNNSLIDGTQTATVTATLSGMPPGTATMQIIDNESTLLSIYVPTTTLSEGGAPISNSPYVYLAGISSSALTITLSSSDTSELTVPATVTIPAGSSQSGYFTLTPVNDNLKDGSQSVTLTASASGLINGTRTITVTDDDVASFVVSTVASPQTRNAYFNVTFTAKDINGVTISSYAGSPTLTAADGGTALGVTPATVTGFSLGAKTQAVSVADYATTAVLTLTDAAAATSSSSNAFAVSAGPHTKFGWSTIATPQQAGSPANVTITAQDSFGNTVTTFNQAANLTAESVTSVGSATTNQQFPLMAANHDARTQIIYTAAELGGAKTLTSLAWNILAPTNQPLNAFTIRLKHTTKADFAGANGTWETSGWTVCHQSTQLVRATGWQVFHFTTPFVYDGVQNLVMDISFNNTSSGTSANVVGTSAGAYRLMIQGSNSANGDPLTWAAVTPTPYIDYFRPDIRLGVETGVSLTPATTENFTAGVWTGGITFPSPATNIRLKAANGSLSGVSNTFSVNATGILSVTLPASASESSGSVAGTISLNAAQASSLTVTLSSTDTTEASPASATVTIPAGSTSVPFTLLIANDTLADGAQFPVITASAAGFAAGSTSISVQDDDVHHLTFGSISSPQPSGQAFPISLQAFTVDDQPATAIHGATAALSATVNGVPASVSPASTGSFVSNLWSGSINITGAGVTTISATYGSISTTSSSFTLGAAAPMPASRFTITGLPSDGQLVSGVSYPVTIRAVDEAGTTDASYSGPADLTARAPGMGEILVGRGPVSTSVLFNNGLYHDIRSQTIYTANQLGSRPLSLTGLGLNAVAGHATTFQNLTIRLKHTALASFTGNMTWATDWTTVFTGSHTFSAGWNSFMFSSPFAYDGTSNLMVDISFDNATTGSSVAVRTTPSSVLSLTYGTSSSTHGSPPAWSGSTPSLSGTYLQPQLRLFLPGGVTVSPARTGVFSSGSLSTSISFQGIAKDLFLEVSDAAGRAGSTSQLVLKPAPVTMTAEPAYTGGTTNTLSWSASGSAYNYEVQASSQAGFSAIDWSASPTLPNVTTAPLTDGTRYYYRTRPQQNPPHGNDEWKQTDWGHFSSDTLINTSASAMGGSVVLAPASGTSEPVTENFDALAGGAWSAQFPVQGGNSGYSYSSSMLTAGPNTTPALPINQGGDIEGRVSGSFTWCYTTDTAANTFSDGTIEATIAPETPASAMSAALILRGSPSGSAATGYVAMVSFISATQASIFIGHAASGSSWIAFPTQTLATSDNIRLRFTATGPRLVLNAWKINVSGGSVVETPVLTAGGSPDLIVYDTLLSSGRAGMRFAAGTSAFLLDDLSITMDRPVYPTSGTLTSPLISPAVRQNWGVLKFTGSIPSGTAMSVDVLDASDSILAANIANGASLGSLPAVASAAAIKLRANLSTTLSTATPRLDDWSVSYGALPLNLVAADWSPAVFSTQDATPPVLTIPAHTTTAAGITLAGSAIDATSGLASVLVGGTPAATSNAFATWTTPVNGLVDGSNSITVTASDNAVPPNITTATAIVFRLENPASDLDDDGINSLLEHAFGIPAGSANARTMLPAAANETEAGQNYLCMQFRRRIQRAGLTYIVETSADLITWDATGSSVVEKSAVPTGDGVTELVTVRVTPAIDLGGAKFVRLRITTN
jgi:hypothetical protein